MAQIRRTIVTYERSDRSAAARMNVAQQSAKAIPMRQQRRIGSRLWHIGCTTSWPEIEMKNDPRVPERKDAEDKEFPCRSCGEKFNSLAETEQHEKDCRNRKASGAKPAEPE